MRILCLMLIAALGGCGLHGISSNPGDASVDLDMGTTNDLSGADLSGADLSGQPPADMVRPINKDAGPPTFSSGMPYSAGVEPHWMDIGDITGDGKLDVAVTSFSNTNTLLVLIGDGNGGFGAPVSTTLKAPSVLGVADFNGDHKADVIVNDQNPTASNTGEMDLLPSKGDGTFGTPTPYLICVDNGNGCPAVGGGVQSLVVTDLNGDLRPDVAVAQPGYVTSPMVGNIANFSAMLGTSNGGFQTKGPYRASQDFPAGPNAIAAGDFNGDQHGDLVYVQGNNKVIIMLGSGDGTFQVQSAITASSTVPGAVATGDFNNDGKIDLLTLDASVNLSLGNGNGTFQPYVAKPAGGGAGEGLAVADFNNDGNLDIVAPNYNAGTATVLVGHGDGNFDNNITLNVGTPGSSKPLYVLVGDLNGDGKPDIIVNDMSILTVFLNTTP